MNLLRYLFVLSTLCLISGCSNDDWEDKNKKQTKEFTSYLKNSKWMAPLSRNDNTSTSFNGTGYWILTLNNKNQFTVTVNDTYQVIREYKYSGSYKVVNSGTVHATNSSNGERLVFIINKSNNVLKCSDIAFADFILQ
ncbi:MAG: hypothetical protein RSE35_03335 [Bacteroidales bacterium]